MGSFHSLDKPNRSTPAFYENGDKFVKQLKFEDQICLNLNLDEYTDESLSNFLEKQLDIEFKPYTRASIIKTVKQAENRKKYFQSLHIFNSDTFQNTIEEQQWIRDLYYYKKYKNKKGVKLWEFCPNDIKRFIKGMRKADPATIMQDANVFMTNEKKYKFFKYKLKKYYLQTSPIPSAPHINDL